MIRDLMDVVFAVIFCTGVCFGSVEAYKFFKAEAKKMLEKGLSETLPLSRALSGKKFDWEVE